MIKYLDYVLSFLNSLEYAEDIPLLCNEINLYKDYWNKYINDISRNPIYHSTPNLFDRHIFNLHTNESVSISWDIDNLYKFANSNIKQQYITIDQFEEITNADLMSSIDELSRIDKEVNSIHSHSYTPILLINFKPTNNVIILDGRHRYMEYKKFKSNELVPVYLLDDEQCFDSIIMKKEFLTYIILHNISVINNYIQGKCSLDHILNLKMLIVSNFP